MLHSIKNFDRVHKSWFALTVLVPCAFAVIAARYSALSECDRIPSVPHLSLAEGHTEGGSNFRIASRSVLLRVAAAGVVFPRRVLHTNVRHPELQAGPLPDAD